MLQKSYLQQVFFLEKEYVWWWWQTSRLEQHRNWRYSKGSAHCYKSLTTYLGGRLAVIKANDNHFYYLLKLLANPYKKEEMVIHDYHQLIFHQHMVMLLRITSNWIYQTKNVISIILTIKERSFFLLFVLMLIAHHLRLLWRRNEIRSKHLITGSVNQKLCKTVNYFDVNNS